MLIKHGPETPYARCLLLMYKEKVRVWYTEEMEAKVSTTSGHPYPLGVTACPDGTNFSIFSAENPSLKLCLYSLTKEMLHSLTMKKTGEIFHLLVQGLSEEFLYLYETEDGKLLLDPYAKAISSSSEWKSGPLPYRPFGLQRFPAEYDWEGDRPLRLPKEQLIIYEMHVRGFTQDISSKVNKPGSFSGIIEKIPHLLELGINAVELLPIFEFDERAYAVLNPETKKELCNFWGYSTINFFSLMNRYGSSLQPIQEEFKDLVKALHRSQIEVILDVVFNHTGEGNEKGPLLSFKGLGNEVYYHLDEQQQYLNFSGCGNTLNCNHPIVCEFIINALRFWVTEYHIDGFRFDLASIFSRGRDGHPLSLSPVVEAISLDPLLANTKLIAEAWDAAGLYQVGNFYPKGDRWSEWNGAYRDDVRRFLKDSHSMKGNFATRLSGSNDLYFSQSPMASVNFVTCHDGFTLSDLVTYNQKHNFENGENNQDGTSSNDSWNCGVEGPSEDREICGLREKQMRNFHMALLLSQGIPLLSMGDEYGHTKLGNNNTWCQDNQLSWFLWEELHKKSSFFAFYKFLIHFRKNHPHFCRKDFLGGKDVVWHGVKPLEPDWDNQNGLVAFALLHEQSDLYIAFNASDESLELELPAASKNTPWKVVINTGNLPPEDFYLNPPIIFDQSLILSGHSSILLISTLSEL